jgi:hypothetical protein
MRDKFVEQFVDIVCIHGLVDAQKKTLVVVLLSQLIEELERANDIRFKKLEQGNKDLRERLDGLTKSVMDLELSEILKR